MQIQKIIIIQIIIKLISGYFNDFLYQAVGFWELGESLEDSSFVNNSAIQTESIPTTQGFLGNDNGALDFSASTGRIEISPQPQYALGTGDLTISVFFKAPAATSSPTGYIFGDSNLHIARNTNNPNLWISFCEQEFYAMNILDDQWHHLVLIRKDVTTVQFYIDAELYYNFNMPAIYECQTNFNETICIGDFCSGGFQFDGQIDQVALYKIALSEFQIIQLYQQNLEKNNCPGFCTSCTIDGSKVTCDSCIPGMKQQGNICVCETENQQYNYFTNSCESIFKPNLQSDIQYPLKADVNDAGKLQNHAIEYDAIDFTYGVADFATNDAVMEIPSNQYTSFYSDYTISLWFSTNSAGQGFILDMTPYLNQVLQIFYSGGNLFFLEDYDTSNIRYFSQAYSDYTWNFLAVTYSYQENMYRIYLNGDLQQNIDSSATFPLETWPATIYIGNIYGHGYGFPGYITDVRIYHEKLSKKQFDFMWTLDNNYCPAQCSNCTLDAGGYTCNVCEGNKDLNSQLDCVCDDGYDFNYNDFNNCIKNSGLISYYQFSQNIEDQGIAQNDMTIQVFEIKYDEYGDKYAQLRNSSGDPLINLYSTGTTYSQNGQNYSIYADGHEGNSDEAANFLRGNMRLMIGPTTKNSFLYDDFSISFWIKAGTSGIRNAQIFEISNYLDIERQETNSNLKLRNGNKLVFVENVLNNNWQHIAFVRHSKTLVDIYVNGTLNSQNNDIGLAYIEDPKISIGVSRFLEKQDDETIDLAEDTDNDYPIFKGYLDELRIYNKKLIKEEVVIAQVYPECPYFCTNCTLTNGDLQFSIECNVCLGGRVKNTQNICVCPEGYIDSQDSVDPQCHEQVIEVVDPLQIYYSFDDDISDLSQNGEPIPSVLEYIEFTQDKFGVENRAIDFSQNDQSIIKITDNSLFNFEDKPFTVIFSVKAQSQGNKWGTILGNSDLGLFVTRYIDTSDMRISIAGTYFTIPNALNGNWNTISIEKSDTVTIYLNSTLIIDEQELQNKKLKSNIQVCLGDSCDSNSPFDGQLDEFRVYRNHIVAYELIEQINDFQCDFICNECNIKYKQQSVGKCLSCRGATRYLEQGNCLCPRGYYDTLEDEDCLPCPQECDSCIYENNQIKCTICKDNEQISNPQDQQLYNQTQLFDVRNIDSLCKCPQQNFYDDLSVVGTNYCLSCNNNRCQTCQNSQNCDQCVGTTDESKQQRQQSQTCQCPLGFYDDVSQIDCKKCNEKTPHCKICDNIPGPDSGKCFECEGDLMPLADQNLCQCPKGFYAADLLNMEEIQCKQCPNNAKCPGGYELQVDPQYWRINKYSDEILPCNNNPDSCKGGLKTGNDICKPGYIGALCESCDIENIQGQGSFGKESDFTCVSCDKVSNQVSRIVLMFVIQMVGLYLSVTGTLSLIEDRVQFNSLKILFKTSNPQADEKGVMIKILQNYFYIIGTLGSFQLTLPDSIKNFSSQTSNPQKNMAFSFDCFLYGISTEIPLQYFRIIWQLGVSVLQVVFVVLLGVLVIKAKKENISVRSLLWTTIFYQFIALQPGFISMLLDSIVCRKIGEQYYILGNTSYMCSDYPEYKFILILPLLLLLLIFIPLFMVLFLRRMASSNKPKNQKTLVHAEKQKEIISESQENQQIAMLNWQEKEKYNPIQQTKNMEKYGFLYLEYRDQVYWWEIVKVVQKTLIACLLAFYYNHVYVKGILVVLTIIAYLSLVTKYQPYKMPSQTYIDKMASAITGVTLILGLFIYKNDFEYLEIIGILVMVLLNVYFLVIMLERILRSHIKTIVRKIKSKHDKIENQKELQSLVNQIKQKQEQYNHVNNQIINYKAPKDPQIDADVEKELLQLEKQKFLKQIQVMQFIIETIQSKQLLEQKKQDKKDNLKNPNLSANNKPPSDYIYKMFHFVETIGNKYFKQSTRKIQYDAKLVQFKIKQFLSTYVQGIQYGLIQITDQNTLSDDIVQLLNQDVKIIYQWQILQGLTTDQQLHNLENNIETINKINHVKDHIILNKIQQKFLEYVANNKILQKLQILKNRYQQAQNNSNIVKNSTNTQPQILNNIDSIQHSTNNNYITDTNRISNLNQQDSENRQFTLQQSKSNSEHSQEENDQQQENNIQISIQQPMIQSQTFKPQTRRQSKFSQQNKDLKLQLSKDTSMYNTPERISPQPQQEQELNQSQETKSGGNSPNQSQSQQQQINNSQEQNNSTTQDLSNIIQSQNPNFISVLDTQNQFIQSSDRNQQNQYSRQITEEMEEESTDNNNDDKNSAQKISNFYKEQQEEILKAQKQLQKDYVSSNMLESQSFQLNDNLLQNFKSQNSQNSNNNLTSQNNNNENVTRSDDSINNLQAKKVHPNSENTFSFSDNHQKASQKRMSIFSKQSQNNQQGARHQSLQNTDRSFTRKKSTRLTMTMNQLQDSPKLSAEKMPKIMEQSNIFQSLNLDANNKDMKNMLITDIEEQFQQEINFKVNNVCDAFNEQEILDFLLSFQILDKKKEGKINMKSFLSIIDKLELNIPIKQVQLALIKAKGMDIQQEKEEEEKQINIDFSEYLSLILFKQFKKYPIQELSNIFSNFNLKANGYLDCQEMKNMIDVLLKENVSEQTVQALINLEDKDHDGILNIQEFINLVL